MNNQCQGEQQGLQTFKATILSYANGCRMIQADWKYGTMATILWRQVSSISLGPSALEGRGLLHYASRVRIQHVRDIFVDAH